MRKLATIRKITKIEPIPGKDRVEMAYIDGWTAMVSKADNFKSGDTVVFCEEDSVFPQEEQWEFLKKYNYRIKIQRFKANEGYVYSQGLVLPLHVLGNTKKVKLGDDVTEILHITQYEPEMDGERDVSKKNSFLMRFKWYRNWVKKHKKDSHGFPREVSKTDEERIQNYMSQGFDCYTDDNDELRIRDVDEYIRRVKAYAGATELTRRMCLDLIEYVTVDENNKRHRDKPRRIHVYYKFIDKGLTDKHNALA